MTEEEYYWLKNQKEKKEVDVIPFPYRGSAIKIQTPELEIISSDGRFATIILNGNELKAVTRLVFSWNWTQGYDGTPLLAVTHSLHPKAP